MRRPTPPNHRRSARARCRGLVGFFEDVRRELHGGSTRNGVKHAMKLEVFQAVAGPLLARRPRDGVLDFTVGRYWVELKGRSRPEAGVNPAGGRLCRRVAARCDPCDAPAGAGTRHQGFGWYRLHYGNSPRGCVHAAKTEAIAMAEEVPARMGFSAVDDLARDVCVLSKRGRVLPDPNQSL